MFVYKMIRCVIFVVLFAVTRARNSSKGVVTGVAQDDDKWIWGFVDETENKFNDKDKDKIVQKENDTSYDPCGYYNPEKPSFKAPGRKISEEKCEEYLWTVKLWEEQSKRGDECIDKMFADQAPPPGAVGGRPTYSGEFPHMGAIGWKAAEGSGYIFKCGSTLISSKFVLTAAHCSRSPVDESIVDSKPAIVRLNDKNLFHRDEEGFFKTTDVKIKNIINHPNYTSPKKYYDIALMELEDEVTFTRFMQPACLWTKHDLTELGSDATLTGWGVLKFGSTEISPELQAADVDLISSEQCDRLLFKYRSRNWQGLMEHQLCAGKLAGGVDSCQGDSGGPLQVLKYKGKDNTLHNVIGVTSFGIGCAIPNLPGIYTRVSSFVDWIEGIVWK